MGIMNANKKEIKSITAADLNVAPEQLGLKGSFTEVVDIFAPEPRGKGIVITESDPSNAAKKIVDFLKAKAIV